MSFLRHKKGNLERLVSLDGIRHVDCIQASSIGGPPYDARGRITYVDGYVMEVSFGLAEAVQKALKSQTIRGHKE